MSLALPNNHIIIWMEEHYIRRTNQTFGIFNPTLDLEKGQPMFFQAKLGLHSSPQQTLQTFTTEVQENHYLKISPKFSESAVMTREFRVNANWSTFFVKVSSDTLAVTMDAVRPSTRGAAAGLVAWKKVQIKSQYFAPQGRTFKPKLQTLYSWKHTGRKEGTTFYEGRVWLWNANQRNPKKDNNWNVTTSANTK